MYLPKPGENVVTNESPITKCTFITCTLLGLSNLTNVRDCIANKTGGSVKGTGGRNTSDMNAPFCQFSGYRSEGSSSTMVRNGWTKIMIGVLGLSVLFFGGL